MSHPFHPTPIQVLIFALFGSIAGLIAVLAGLFVINQKPQINPVQTASSGFARSSQFGQLLKFSPTPVPTPTPISNPPPANPTPPTSTPKPTPKLSPTPTPSSTPPTPKPTPTPTPTPTTQIQINTTIPVLIVKYFPLNGDKLDTVNAIKDTYGEYNFTLAQIRSRTNTLTSGIIDALHQGSSQYLRYQILDTKEKLAAIPLSSQTYNGLPLPDYKSMLTDVNICDYVNNRGVKEVWLWSYGGTGKSGWESNMAGKYGDISNSNQDANDLPICAHTYVVYDYNYGRGVSEAIEDHMHQIEVTLKYADYTLFWDKFVGSNQTPARHCGWAHYPPNAAKDYDWANTSYVTSDCEDWNPNGTGNTQSFNCTRWNCNSLQFFIWWMQNLPGQNNNLSYQGKALKNWWEFIADFDQAMAKGKSLTN